MDDRELTELLQALDQAGMKAIVLDEHMDLDAVVGDLLRTAVLGTDEEFQRVVEGIQKATSVLEGVDHKPEGSKQ